MSETSDLQESEHEHVFPEERESSGRCILAPCLTCDLAAIDALEQAGVERDQYDREAQMWSMSAKDYLRVLLPLMTEQMREAFESTGELPTPAAITAALSSRSVGSGSTRVEWLLLNTTREPSSDERLCRYRDEASARRQVKLADASGHPILRVIRRTEEDVTDGA